MPHAQPPPLSPSTLAPHARPLEDQPLLARVALRLTSPPILTGLLCVLALGLAVLGIVSISSHIVDDTQPLVHTTGDFMAFRTGAELLATGQGEHLYDLDVQHTTQVRLSGQEHLSTWQPYVNPPLLALVLMPTASMSYLAGFLWFIGGTTAALFASLLLLKGQLHTLGSDRLLWWTTALAVLCFHPIFHTAIGGQNTAFTLCLITATFVGFRTKNPWLTGLALGALTYKPQFAIVLAGLLILRRHWLAVALSAAVGLVHYGLGALWCGWRWPLDMLTGLAAYRPLESASNGLYHIAILPAAESTLPGAVATPVAGILIVAVLGVVAVFAHTTRQHSSSDSLVFALAVTGAMLTSPHLQYYDVGLLALPVVLGLDSSLGRGAPPLHWIVRGGIVAGWLSYSSWQLGPTLGVQPLILVVAATLCWLIVLLRRPSPQPPLV